MKGGDGFHAFTVRHSQVFLSVAVPLHDTSPLTEEERKFGTVWVRGSFSCERGKKKHLCMEVVFFLKVGNVDGIRIY